MEVHVAFPLLPPRVHVVNVPDLLLVMLTVPMGVIGVPDPVSVTITVHVVPVPARRVVGEQSTESDVVRGVTVRVVEAAQFTVEPLQMLAQLLFSRV